MWRATGYYASMTLPRLRADLRDEHAVARLLRATLRQESQVVPLRALPVSHGEHLLEIDVPGQGMVTLVAEPLGRADRGYVLRVRALTRAQMAELLALIERIDAPSTTEPPPPTDLEWSGDRQSSPDRTLVDARQIDGRPFGEVDVDVDVVVSVPPARFGVIDSAMPGPPSSDSGDSIAPLVIPPAPKAPSASLLVGRVIAGKYLIEAPIGSGMTAAVFRALHTDLKRHLAVKILHEHKLEDPQFVKRFKAEAFAASKLEHPNITRVIDFGEEKDGLLYLVMELLVGKSLEQVLKAEGRLSQQKAVELTIQACTALAFAHDNGIIHRDVKPENLMLVAHRDDDGNPCDLVKVCDFGLAKLRAPEGGAGGSDADAPDLTTAGMLCGSPAYMSPEQTRGEVLDPRSDIYALGVTLFQTLTGELPHEADGLAQFFLKKMLEPPRRPSSLLADIDPLLEDVLLRAIATDRGARHATARVLREELREVLASMAVPSSEERERTIVAG